MQQEAQQIIYAQEVSLRVKRTAWELFQHEQRRINPNTKKRYTTRKALTNVLKWIAGQAAKEKLSPQLTPTERKILQLAVEGLAQKEIALELGCTLRTVQAHFTSMRMKAKVRSTPQLAALAVERGWVKAPKVDD
jgi:DNA-binding CsgD family transcriptional regulator